MYAQRETQTTTATATVSRTPAANGLLQRQCAFGCSPGVEGECAACRQKRLQRQPATQAELAGVPPIVHDVLAAPGRPLDPATRAFMEPRFGHDFSQVRVHTDTQAAQSAQAVNALAYTVGRDVVFGDGQYAPGLIPGRRLLLHELTHVVQQNRTQSLAPLSLTQPTHASEIEATRVAASLGEGPAGMTRPVLAPPTIVAPAYGIQRDVGWARRGPYPYGTPGSMPTSDVDTTVSETISNAPAPYGAWNGRFSWSSRFHLTLDLNSGALIVSVRLYSTATREQKQAWKAAIESKWSRRYNLVVAPAEAGSAEQRYPIVVDLQWVDEAGKADYTITAQSAGAAEGGRAGAGGTTSMLGWGTADTVDVTHEFGHMLGNPEDYFMTNGTDFTNGGRRRGFRDVGGGIMNNPSEDPFTRHYELIRQHAAKLLGVPDARCSVK